MKILKAGGSYKLSGRLSKAGSKISAKLISELYNLSISKIREFQLQKKKKKKIKKKKKKKKKKRCKSNSCRTCIALIAT